MLWSNLNKIFKYYYRSIIRQMISLFPNMNATKLFRWYYFKNLHFFSPSPSLNEGAPSQVDYRRLFFPAVFPNFQYLPPLDLDSPDATDISFGMASPINPSLLYFPPNPGLPGYYYQARLGPFKRASDIRGLSISLGSLLRQWATDWFVLFRAFLLRGLPL